jgi:hypothetical protein
MITRLRFFLAIVVVAVSVNLVLVETALGASHSTFPHAQSAAVGAPMTRIVLRVNSCRHCPVYLQQAIQGRGRVWQSSTHRVRGGMVRFRVPTWRTHGLSFNFSPRWQTAAEMITNVVTRYAHTRVGQRIANRVARAKKRATACWMGTSKARVVLSVRAVKFPAPNWMTGKRGHGLRVWFNPMRSSTPPMSRTWRGTLGNQQAYYCQG